MQHTFLCVALLTVMAASAGQTPAVADDTHSPYGVCAHLPSEGPVPPRLEMMREAGVRWVRSDFNWRGVEPQKGQWQFDRLDRLVDDAEQAGIRLLPILDYSVPWANPAHENLDDWLTYVRKVVGRYHDRLRYWEVWNEENIPKFWPNPDPAAYVRLLKETYRTIKEIDPELVVLYGGTAEIPFEYIEETFNLGAGDFFDVMAVHPYSKYHWPEEAELYEHLVRLRELMARYNLAQKPIWITEIGWPAHRSPFFGTEGGAISDIIRAGLSALAPERRQWTIGVLDDPDYPDRFTLPEAMLQHVAPGEVTVERVELEELGELDFERVPALMMPLSEAYPGRRADELAAYVRQGGILIFSTQVPLYYAYRRDAERRWRRTVDLSLQQRLHLGWEASWRGEDVPRASSQLAVPHRFSHEINLPKGLETSRFLTEGRLKPGDRMIPLVEARHGDWQGVAAAAYDFDSDLKGGIVASTFLVPGIPFTLQEQAQVLPRAYLLSLRAGVDCVFWYEFQAEERRAEDAEQHFGIVSRQLDPRPAYQAYHTMTRARPAGSVADPSLPLCSGDVYRVCWQRPDGRTAWAVWRPHHAAERRLRIEGRVEAAYDYLGQEVVLDVQAQMATVRVGHSLVYLIGPQRVEVVE